MKIIVALLVFSAIIIVHELGHFLLAKKNGITVNEFALGMGPRLLSFERGGTEYCLKLLPFGGSCMMMGEDGEDEGEGSFGSKSVWARISVIAAGPVFNFLLAFVLSLFIVGNIGYDPAIVLGVTEGYPAEAAGMQEGDVITKMNGKTIRLYRQFSDYVMFHTGETILFECERNGEKYEMTIEPVMTENGYKFGIAGSVNYRQKTGLIDTIKYSAYEVYYWIDTTLQSLAMVARGGVKLDDMSGPVGVVEVIGDTYEESKSEGVLYIWLNMFNIAILLTANLGVMNLLPIPALDGGRLVFLIIEAIRGKRLDPEMEGKIHFTGLMLLLLLMVIIMFNDIKKIFL